MLIQLDIGTIHAKKLTTVFYNTSVRDSAKLNMNLKERTAKDVCAAAQASQPVEKP